MTIQQDRSKPRVRYRTDGAKARAWARAQDMPVAEDGRVAAGVLSAWRAAGEPNMLGTYQDRLPSDAQIMSIAIALVLRIPETDITKKRLAGSCIVCGSLLARNSRTGICRGNSNCHRLNTSVHNLISRVTSNRVTCAKCQEFWMLNGGDEKLCPTCNTDYFWCSRIKEASPGHVERRQYMVSDNQCRVCRLLAKARERSIEKKIAFSLTRSDIKWNDICPYLGIPLIFGSRKLHMSSPSLDRINSALGYIPGNVEVISYQANTMKHAASPEQLLKFARVIINRYGGNDE